MSVTAPKTIERRLTNGLRQDEVNSRLSALANTLDSRGWAVKNVNVNLSTPTTTVSPTENASDRLVHASSLPQVVSSIDVSASDDILDESANPIAQNFDSMITAAGTAHHQQLVTQLQQPYPAAPAHDSRKQRPQPRPEPRSHPVPQQRTQPADYWFMQDRTPTVNQPGQVMFADEAVVTPGLSPRVDAGAPQAALPTADEEALVDKLKTENDSSSMTAAYGHMKTLKTPEQLAAEARAAAKAATAKPPVTPTDQAAIINLANNDDLDVATIARQAHEQVSSDNDGEVVISLH